MTIYGHALEILRPLFLLSGVLALPTARQALQSATQPDLRNCVLLLAEKAIAQEILEGIEENRPYKEIYQIIKSRITENLIGIAADIAKGD